MALEETQLGHYRLVRLIGKGGMGEVYFAEDTRISRKVAIKVVRNEAQPYPNSAAAKESVRLFEREMKAIASLDHPNILPLIDFGEEIIDKAVLSYMVMPFRSEGSLIDWVRQHSTDTLSSEEVVHIIIQAASALKHAHNHRLMHLDVKPSNFLIRSREDHPRFPDVLLADFGIARFTSTTTTASQNIRGTPAYMAPEQWTGSPVAATDQYALGIMTYQLLSQRLPFLGTMQQVMYQHLQVQPQTPSAFNQSIPHAVDEVILRALAKNPEDRFPSIQAFATAFEQNWTNEKAHALPPAPPTHQEVSQSFYSSVSDTTLPPSPHVSPTPKLPSWKPRRSRLNFVLGLIALVVLGSIAFALLGYSWLGTYGRSNGITPTPSVTRTRSLKPSPIPSYPQLKPSYSGTEIGTSSGAASSGFYLNITSQDQHGNISATLGFSSSNSVSNTCRGSVTTDKHISLVCTGVGDYVRNLQGVIHPDGHIEGTDKTTEMSNSNFLNTYTWSIS